MHFVLQVFMSKSPQNSSLLDKILAYNFSKNFANAVRVCAKNAIRFWSVLATISCNWFAVFVAYRILIERPQTMSIIDQRCARNWTKCCRHCSRVRAWYKNSFLTNLWANSFKIDVIFLFLIIVLGKALKLFCILCWNLARIWLEKSKLQLALLA